MNSNKHLEKWLPLYLYDELPAEEKKELEVHLQYCQRCRGQLDEMRALHEALDCRKQGQPTEAVLMDLRKDLRDRLQVERRNLFQETWWLKIRDAFRIERFGVPWLAAATILIMGFFLGRFSGSGVERESRLPTQVTAKFPDEQFAQPLISNIDLMQYDPESGKVTVRYKSMNDVFLEGNIHDESVRKLLVHVLRREDHPGQRLTAVKAFGGQNTVDAEIEQALIYAVEHDQVDGVRLKAARVLKTLPINNNIKAVFIRVLLKDSNPAIRIEAVDALSKLKSEKDVVPILQDVARDDDNEYIRLKSSKLLERRENPSAER